jgi:hypothetical protein
MLQGAMQDYTIAEGREHLILNAVWSPVLQHDRSAFFARCWHMPSCPQSCCICTVPYCMVFNFIPNRWQRLRLIKGILVHITNNFMSTISVLSILHMCIIVLSFCRERALCRTLYRGDSHILVNALLAMYLMHEIFYQKQHQKETVLYTCL